MDPNGGFRARLVNGIPFWLPFLPTNGIPFWLPFCQTNGIPFWIPLRFTNGTSRLRCTHGNSTDGKNLRRVRPSVRPALSSTTTKSCDRILLEFFLGTKLQFFLSFFQTTKSQKNNLRTTMSQSDFRNRWVLASL
jgi:hypothetical protein